MHDPAAYWPMERWAVRRLDGDELEAFRVCFDDEFWSTIPAIEGAVEACHDLVNAGYELVCVTAMELHFETARLRNLQYHGFPISRVIATSNALSCASPKAAALRALGPVAFVDDYLPYLRGIPEDVHAALVLREPNGSPNRGEGLEYADSQHADLADFARWWLTQR